MSLRLPLDTLVVLFVAALVLLLLAVPLGIPLLAVETLLALWVDPFIDPLAVAT